MNISACPLTFSLRLMIIINQKIGYFQPRPACFPIIWHHFDQILFNWTQNERVVSVLAAAPTAAIQANRATAQQ